MRSLLAVLGSVSVAVVAFGGCSSEPTIEGSGGLRVTFVLDETTDYAEYSDGAEVEFELDGPIDVGPRVVEGGSGAVAFDEVVPAGTYTVRGALLPCSTDGEPCGPRRDRCRGDVLVPPAEPGDDPVEVVVDYQPGRDCNVVLVAADE